jgi:hypothetical protein
MLELGWDYGSCVKASERVAWKLDEAMPPGTVLDFKKPFLPEALTLTRQIACLDDDERRTLNQIAGNSYLNLFAFVEEYILSTMTQHAAAELFGDHAAIRALARFVDEEVKHQMLFARFKEAFVRDFGTPCKVLDSAVAVAGVIMAKSPIAVMTTTLHIELMTQQHYTECVKDDQALDPFFARLLHLHWLEEAQHARIDALELDKLLDGASTERIKGSFDDYLGIIGAFDGLLAQQARFDVESLTLATKRAFAESEKAEIARVAHKAYRKTFLTYGMRNPTFLSTVKKISPADGERIAARARELDWC